MTVLSQSAFLNALAWSLLNSLWQFAALWLLFIAFTNIYKKNSATTKYNVAIIFLSIGCVAVFANFMFKLFEKPAITVGTALGSNAYNTVQQYITAALPYLSLAYLCITGILLLRFIYLLYTSHLLQTKGLVKISPVYRLYVNELAMHMSISKKISVWLSEKINTPVLIGYFKPVILLPLAAINQLSQEQVEAILLHEIAHIKRNDYLVNLLISLVNIFLFFNPFSRLFVAVIEAERENCCDDWVLQLNFSAEKYATALLSLEKNRQFHLAVSLSFNGKNKNQLLHRVRRIMNVPVEAKLNRKQVIVPLFFMIFSLALFIQPHNTVNNASNIIITPHYTSIQQVAYQKNEQPFLENNFSQNVEKTKAIAKSKEPKVIKEAISITTIPAETYLPQIINVSNDISLHDVPVLVTTTYTDSRNFVIPAKPEPVINVPGNSPYVPVSSFSYYYIQDSISKITSDTRDLKVALLKATIALTQAQKTAIPDKDKLIKNLQETITHINYYCEKHNAAEIIDMQATALMQAVTGAIANSRGITIKTNSIKIDSLQKEIKIVKKGSVISL